MNELVVVNQAVIGSKEVNTVSARDLYLGLGLDKSNWARWAKENIEDNEFFSAGRDFTGLVIMTSPNNAVPSQDFLVTLDFAKHLAMMAKTKKAHDYRNYFLDCEDRLEAVHKAQVEALHNQALNALRLELDAKVEVLRDEAEKAIKHNTMHTNLLHISLQYGLTSKERSVIYAMIDNIAAITEDPGASNNAISSHLHRRYMHKGWLGPISIPFDDAVAYLERVQKAYETGYRPVYKHKLLSVDDHMLSL